MHKPESVLEKETLKIVWDLERKTGPLVPARGPDFVILNNGSKDRVQSQVESYQRLRKTVLDTQQYKLRIKSKVEQSREWSRAFPYTSV